MMGAYETAVVRKTLVAAAHAWFAGAVLGTGTLPPDTTVWLYQRDIDWGKLEMAGKRIRIEMRFEDEP